MGINNKATIDTGGEPQKHIMNSNKPFGYKKKTDQSIDLIVKSSVTITHDEHAKMVLEPGTYSKTNQMEFDPFNNTVSYIFD